MMRLDKRPRGLTRRNVRCASLPMHRLSDLVHGLGQAANRCARGIDHPAHAAVAVHQHDRRREHILETDGRGAGARSRCSSAP
jgi:hypothetical protein